MDFPKLQNGQHAVIAAEIATGIILRIDGQHRLANFEEAWRVFDSLDAARKFAAAEGAKNPAIEFGIYDEKQQPIQIVRYE